MPECSPCLSGHPHKERMRAKYPDTLARTVSGQHFADNHQRDPVGPLWPLPEISRLGEWTDFPQSTRYIFLRSSCLFQWGSGELLWEVCTVLIAWRKATPWARCIWIVQLAPPNVFVPLCSHPKLPRQGYTNQLHILVKILIAADNLCKETKSCGTGEGDSLTSVYC